MDLDFQNFLLIFGTSFSEYIPLFCFLKFLFYCIFSILKLLLWNWDFNFSILYQNFILGTKKSIPIYFFKMYFLNFRFSIIELEWANCFLHVPNSNGKDENVLNVLFFVLWIFLTSYPSSLLRLPFQFKYH